MIRLLHIDDPKLRERVREKIADWWELDDADFSEILIELRYEDETRGHRDGELED